MHDQVRTAWGARRTARIGAAPPVVLDLAQPAVELVGAAAIRGRKRADYAAFAGCADQLDAGDEEHRRGNQRQA